jgi:cobaltochelatase CobS
MSLAFMDRAVKLEFGYAKHDVEVSILQKAVPSLPQDVLEKMVDLANAVRRQFMAGDMEITMSTRSLIRWARIFVHDDQVFSGNKKNTGRNLLVDALDKTVGFQAEDTTKESLHLLCQSHFG